MTSEKVKRLPPPLTSGVYRAECDKGTESIGPLAWEWGYASLQYYNYRFILKDCLYVIMYFSTLCRFQGFFFLAFLPLFHQRTCLVLQFATLFICFVILSSRQRQRLANLVGSLSVCL